MTSRFATELKRQRTAAGVSQSKLAERAEFDHSYVSRLESGARIPSREAVDRLAEALDASADDHERLLEAAGYLAAGAVPVSFPYAAELHAAFNHADAADCARLEAALALIVRAIPTASAA